MNIVFVVITVLYGLLSIIAGALGLKQKKSSRLATLMMITGGVLLIVSVLITKNNLILSAITLLVGLVLNHISAILSGIKIYGKINVGHHIIRLIISAAVIILYFFIL
ncbi:hypothetical protein [Clostridium fungisolvens]|uniref:Uncharacterized protein n=1 Tax=Clostridium fungisolvens TaxID=1604897 RepID=A0A6V8SCQ4_9CLOT|nr:hypothetical protein [Clostridium fungisolvens]GFP74840.1 hypothetical protein bsdtw1_00902 [Clostridium fungisolvens]